MRRRSGAGKRFLATVLFTDIVSGTDVATELGDRRWRELLARHHTLIRKELKRFGGHEMDTAGDGFFATFDAPADGIRCACAASRAVHELGIDIRAGLHVGECEQMGQKVGGIAVITGARVLAAAGPSDVLATSTAKDLVAGAGIEFEDDGVHALKGIPGEWRLFRVTAVDGVALPAPLENEAAAHLREAIESAPLLARRRGVIVGAVALVLAVTAIVGFVLMRGEGTIVPAADTLAEIPAGSEAFSRAIDVLDRPSGVAVGEGSIWVISQADGTVQRIEMDDADPVVGTPKSTFGPPTGIAAGEGGAWITTGFATTGSSKSELYRFDPVSNAVQPAVEVPAGTQAIAVGDGALWLGDGVNGRVLRVDPETGQTKDVAVGAQPVAIAVGSGATDPVWVADGLATRVWRIDPLSLEADSFDVGVVSSGIAVDGAGNVWITSSAGNVVTELDATGHTVAVITKDVPAGPVGIAISGSDVWVAGVTAHAVSKIDGSTGTVVLTLPLAGSPSGLATDENGDLWVTVRTE